MCYHILKVNRASAVSGAVFRARVKREAGASPARTRRCKTGAVRQYVTGILPGRRRRALIVKSEDLPWMKLLSHESLAENMCNRIGNRCFWPVLFAQAFFFGSKGIACGIIPYSLCHDPCVMRKGKRFGITLCCGSGFYGICVGSPDSSFYYPDCLCQRNRNFDFCAVSGLYYSRHNFDSSFD